MAGDGSDDWSDDPGSDGNARDSSEEPSKAAHDDPTSPDRWPADKLAELGLERAERLEAAFTYQVLRQRSLCPSSYPRRTGVPAKRPLY
jgi:hypothetical protein